MCFDQDIGKNWAGAYRHDSTRGGKKAACGNDNFIASANPECPQSHFERNGSIADGNGVRHTNIGGEFLFKAAILFAMDQRIDPAALQNLSDRKDFITTMGWPRRGDRHRIITDLGGGRRCLLVHDLPTFFSFTDPAPAADGGLALAENY